MQKCDVIISGGGLVGLALAAALRGSETRVLLVDKTPFESQVLPDFDGRTSAVALSSQRFFANIGVWEKMAKYAQPIRDIRVSDDDSFSFLHYDHREVGTEPFGYMVENRHLRQVLAAFTLEGSNITVRCPESVRSITTHDFAAEASLGNGETWQAPLFIAADGKFSAARAEMGIETLQHIYAHGAIVATIAHEKPHNGLAQERFLPTGPFAVLPMQNNRSSLVWTEPKERVSAYLALPEKEFVREIKRRVGDYLGEITLEGPRFSYPLSFVHAQNYALPRFALVGDAAHAIHPIAGQGVNLGWRDAAVLAELITENRKLGLDIGSMQMLSHYQRWRRFDSLMMLGVTDGLSRLFSNRIGPVMLARRLGLWGVGKMTALKKQFMRHAMGVTGDVPKLMKPINLKEAA